jgi:hypothetical protein
MLALVAIVVGLVYMWRKDILERIESVERRCRDAATQDQMASFGRELNGEILGLVEQQQQQQQSIRPVQQQQFSRSDTDFNSGFNQRPGFQGLPPPPPM